MYSAACAQYVQSLLGFQIRLNYAEFAQGMLIARRPTFSQQFCTPCAHSSHIMQTYDTLCVLCTNFEHFCACCMLMSTYSIQQLCAALRNVYVCCRTKLVQSTNCCTARRKKWNRQNVGWFGWFIAVKYLAEGRGPWKDDLSAGWRRKQQARIYCVGGPSLVQARTSALRQRSSCAAIPWEDDNQFPASLPSRLVPATWFTTTKRKTQSAEPLPHQEALRRVQRSQDARQERPEIWVYSRHEIGLGHKDYSGRHYIYSKPFKKFHHELRTEYGFFVHPAPFYTGRKRDFEMDLVTC